jgi:transcriptional regulator with XRE-family HTH domain
MTKSKKNATEGLNGAIAGVIRGELAIRGLRREQLSADSGVPLETLKNYLSTNPARASMMNLDVVTALAEALGMTPVALILKADALQREEEQRAAGHTSPGESIGRAASSA